MSELFEYLSKWKNLLLLTCLFLLFNFLLTNLMPKDYALDLLFAFSPEEAYNALSHLDLEQRKLYRFGIWALDMPYRFIYCFLFSGILLKVLKSKKWVLVPVFILVMDFFENLMILRMLQLFPAQEETLAIIASCFTTMKRILVGVMVLLILFGIIYLSTARHFMRSSSEEIRI